MALAEKIDTLAGFWKIDEKPTGSKDPFALRRAALGTIRLVVENGLRVKLLPVFAKALSFHGSDKETALAADLLAFFADRLKVTLKEKGERHDLIDAVFALSDEDDLVLLRARVAALAAFLKPEDGANLLLGYRRDPWPSVDHDLVVRAGTGLHHNFGVLRGSRRSPPRSTT